MKEVLITSSVLILVILLARQLFRVKVSQRLIYAAWLLVAVRLLVPVQFGQSQYSVTTLTERIENQSQPIRQMQQALKEPVAGPSRAELYEQLLNEYIQQGTDHAQPDATEQITPEIQQQIEVQAENLAAPTLSDILTAVWFVGMSAMAGWFLTANFIFLRRAKKESVSFSEVEAPVSMRISPHVPTPCLVGLFRPVIYLTPACTENEQARTHVLTHELTHLRHGDHIWAMVRCICLCIYWFNPLVWIAASQSRRDCELACDESVLKKLGDGERIAYGKTLLDMVTQSKSPVHLIETATAMNESRKQLKERVSYIVKKPKNILIAAICMVLIAAIATGCTFAGGAITKPGATEPSLMSPTPSTQSTQPPPSIPTLPPTVPPSVTLSPEEEKDLKSAEALIDEYKWYKAVGVCCDFEPVSQDMSRFLTAEQQTEYAGFQYLLKCCHSTQDVRSHIDSRFDSSLLRRGYPDDKLFTDDQGNLYLIVLPTEYDGYRHITLTQRSNDQVVASACIFDEDGCWGSDTFTIQRKDDGFIITQIQRTNSPPEIPSEIPPTSSENYHSATFTLAQERFGLSYVEFLYAGNKIVLSMMEEYDPLNVQAMDLAARDTVAMYQRILYVDHDNTVMMHFPVFSLTGSSEVFSGYYAREFIVPDEPYSLTNAYRWFFGELGQETDGAYTDTYAIMLLEAAFQSPDLFLEYLAECTDATISMYRDWMHNVIVSQEEYNLYVQLLVAISSRTDLTADENDALELLADAPDWFEYTATPANPPAISGSSLNNVNGDDPQLPSGFVTIPPSNTLSHTHVYTTTIVRPTCTVKGYDHHLCRCGLYYCDNFTSATGHDYQLSIIAGSQFPSYTEAGYCTMECQRCGDRYKSYLTAGKDIDFEAILADCTLYAESKGFTVIDPEEWKHEQAAIRKASLPVYQVYRDFTDPPVALTEQMKSMIDGLLSSANGQKYVICLQLSYYANSMGDYYTFEAKTGFSLSD